MKYRAIKPDNLTRALSGRDYIRELARQRDGRCCQKCGKRWKPGMRRFDIHHIRDCGFKSKAYDRISDLDYLITYCHRCHLQLDIVREKMRHKTGNFKLSAEAVHSTFYREKALARKALLQELKQQT